ncbi:SCO7613 C-terminal domain-containing membrane protein [Streptomyces sp. NPDC102274]|uniref:SCO7613 C-terminal domain-containing membrane protein n=1 Tax=Streptomyces sp. NPDC102274 TaxID=3366151 RepID=UPI0038070D52
MENIPPPGQELAMIDQELVRLDARRGQLLARRAQLLSLLARSAPPPWPYALPAPPGSPPSPTPLAAGEVSPPSAQNVLLALGGMLLTVAAIAFTLVSWGHLSVGGRAAVLTVITVAALAVPAVLLRRKLASTAEAVAAFALALMVLDAYALHEVALPRTDGLHYTAGAAAVLAALWAGYGSALGRLRLPLPAALVTAQLPLFLGSLAIEASALTTAWALLVTAALDTALARWLKPGAVRTVTVVAACATAGAALLTGGSLSVAAGTPLTAARPGVLLLAAAGLGLFMAGRAKISRTGPGHMASACAVVAGLAAVAAAGGVVRTAVPDGAAVLGYLLCGVALFTVVRTRLPRAVIRGLAGAAGAVTAASVLWTLPAPAVVLLGALSRITAVWTGAPGDARAAFGVDLPWASRPTAPLVLLIAAGVAASAYRLLPGAPGSGGERQWRVPALGGAVALGWAAVLVAPPALDLGYPAAVAAPLVLTAVLLAVVVRPHTPAGTAGTAVTVTALVCALASSLSVSLLALATRTATVTTLAALCVLFTAAAVAAETVHARGAAAGAQAASRPVRALLACVAVGYATALVAAACPAAGLPAERTAPALLAVPAAVALLGARLRRHPVAPPIELTAAGAAMLAVALASGRAPVLALVLSLCGVIAAGTAVRTERRRVAGYAATALFVLATWVRLASSGVSAPEAYTLPVTLPALAVGLLRRRRDPEASSWTAYGPGLAATLLPSLPAAWGDPDWPRPLLLGLAALALTLAGARLRLQAPLVLGGAALALDALHELAPYVAQLAGVLPRWLPPALAGLLLLAVGATYEQRQREARRLRGTLRRMR